MNIIWDNLMLNSFFFSYNPNPAVSPSKTIVHILYILESGNVEIANDRG